MPVRPLDTCISPPKLLLACHEYCLRHNKHSNEVLGLLAFARGPFSFLLAARQIFFTPTRLLDLQVLGRTSGRQLKLALL